MQGKADVVGHFAEKDLLFRIQARSLGIETDNKPKILPAWARRTVIAPRSAYFLASGQSGQSHSGSSVTITSGRSSAKWRNASIRRV
jgi:hypothetical protein